MLTMIRCQLCVFLVLVFSIPQSKALLYATHSTGVGYTTLSTIDPVTGAMSPIGEPLDVRVSSLAWDSSTQKLYGVAEDVGFFGQPQKLIEIDPWTAAYSIVGPLGSDWCSALTYNPEQDLLYAGAGLPARLSVIDRQSGKATSISDEDASLGALEYIPPSGQTVYAAGGVFQFGTIDTDTGESVILKSGFPEVYGMAYDSARATLYALSIESLYSVDWTTGDYTLVSSLPSSITVGGMAYVPIPEPATAQLVLLAIAISGLRRRSAI